MKALLICCFTVLLYRADARQDSNPTAASRVNALILNNTRVKKLNAKFNVDLRIANGMAAHGKRADKAQVLNDIRALQAIEINELHQLANKKSLPSSLRAVAKEEEAQLRGTKISILNANGGGVLKGTRAVGLSAALAHQGATSSTHTTSGPTTVAGARKYVQDKLDRDPQVQTTLKKYVASTEHYPYSQTNIDRALAKYDAARKVVLSALAHSPKQSQAVRTEAASEIQRDFL